MDRLGVGVDRIVGGWVGVRGWVDGIGVFGLGVGVGVGVGVNGVGEIWG